MNPFDDTEPEEEAVAEPEPAAFARGCQFPGHCLMGRQPHTKSECLTAEMAGEFCGLIETLHTPEHELR
jgi:hypothetical protein